MMGDPRKQRKKYEKPLIPWDERRIDEERELQENYGLKRKEEILKAESFLRNLRRRAREVAAGASEEEEEELLDKARETGLIGEEEGIDEILRIGLRDVLNRRLQTLVSKLNGVQTPKQARQFIVHGHVMVGEKIMKSPSFLVPKELEEKIKVEEKVIQSD